MAVAHLESHGFDMRAARDGKTALKRVATAPVDLILLDVEMPGLDGYETCRRLKAAPASAHIPVVFMTSHTDVQSKVTALSVGAVDYITKPFEPLELLARVRTHLRIGELQETLASRNLELEALTASLAQRVAEQVQTLVERNEEVERLNRHLRTQVQDRSSALSHALRRLSEGRDDDESLDGRVLDGRYEVQAPLAKGGMGAVYTGLDRQSGQAVAIKVIRGDGVHPEQIARFLREAKMAAKVDHPAVVRMLHIDIHDDGLLYQVQELVPGATLLAVLEQHGHLPAGQAARLLSVLAGALAAAHAVGVVHRDLKPSNIILTDTSPGLKLVDFGISKGGADHPEDNSTQDGFAMESNITQVGQAVGTPGFMSPEQRFGLSEGPASDVFAFGILAHLVFTGARSKDGVATKMPPSIGNLIGLCGNYEPDSRPQAQAIAVELSAFADAAGVPPLHVLGISTVD
ncbi:MAG: response regulator [Proteobacteria bacterium]|nr:response regulator [Pseudomonadota bacterium]